MDSSPLFSLIGYLNEQFGPESICHAGDIICELTGEKYSLPTTLSELILKSEEITGISKYFTGPFVLGAAAIITAHHLYGKYHVKTAYDLMLNIIKKEFGPDSVAMEVFNIFQKAITDAIEAEFKKFMTTFPITSKEMSLNDKADLHKQFKDQIIEQIMPTLAQNLKANKVALLQQAQALSEVQPSVANQIVQHGLQASANVSGSKETVEEQMKMFVLEKFLPNQHELIRKIKFTTK